MTPHSRPTCGFVDGCVPRAMGRVISRKVGISGFACSRGGRHRVVDSSRLVRQGGVSKVVQVFRRFRRVRTCRSVGLLVTKQNRRRTGLGGLISRLGLSRDIQFLKFLPRRALGGCVQRSLYFLVGAQGSLGVISVPRSVISKAPVLAGARPTSTNCVRTGGLKVTGGR